MLDREKRPLARNLILERKQDTFVVVVFFFFFMLSGVIMSCMVRLENMTRRVAIFRRTCST